MKIIKSIITISVLLLFASSLFAAEKPRVAVMPFKAGSGVSKPEAKYLTELVRTGLINTGKYDVISNDQIDEMMKVKQQKQGVGSGSCTSEKCIIDLGNALECEKMIVGDAAGATANGRIYIIGGNSNTSYYTDIVEEFDPVTNSWSTKTSISKPRGWFSATTANGRIYAIGGEIDNFGLSAPSNMIEECIPPIY